MKTHKSNKNFKSPSHKKKLKKVLNSFREDTKVNITNKKLGDTVNENEEKKSPSINNAEITNKKDAKEDSDGGHDFLDEMVTEGIGSLEKQNQPEKKDEA